ncbi:hypothetical protein F4U02_11230 [Acinetobacter haemolyticus]|uniref:Uncharacterized protein n=1 Tax=Acinetobacter haemolyticus TaxID=29430 RepID=A0A1L6KJD5_ACIHA|nr:hypothetical protein [Acinetobacter haemolyticus]APR69201.1 hypothetical protein AHTJS_01545 [Acinetobacter haemolyticus]ENW22492.1 hypothetical protein F926_00511 [Acinetobacter haemolyticus NIPH 261]MCU4388296.1 type II toxin-antitoxin system Phd/YefM family antitoxin [Acinetobacter haemolyticus]MQZ31557.1 hypothetical protein [Acinetobacter haemolyticus]NAR18859.1 hypothetical protein [Acinetobacter haemolyticus]
MQISSRDFNQDIGKAKKACYNGPVVITERGKAAHLSSYQRLVSTQQSMAQLLSSDDDVDNVEFEKMITPSKEVDLS